MIYLFYAIQHTVTRCTPLAYNLHGKGTMRPKHQDSSTSTSVSKNTGVRPDLIDFSGDVLDVRIDGTDSPSYYHTVRWDEVTEGRKVRFVDYEANDFGGLDDTEYDGVVLAEKGVLGDYAVLYCSEYDVKVEVSRLRDFKVLG